MNNSKSKFGIGMLVGIVTGAVAGLFLAPKAGKKLRTDVVKRAREIRNKLEDSNVDETIQMIFDEVSEKTTSVYNSAKDMLSEKIAEMSDTVSNIDREKYTSIVDDVMSAVKKDKGVAEQTLVKLKKYLEEDFSKLKSAAPIKKKPAKTVKKRAPKKT